MKSAGIALLLFVAFVLTCAPALAGKPGDVYDVCISGAQDDCGAPHNGWAPWYTTDFEVARNVCSYYDESARQVYLKFLMHIVYQVSKGEHGARGLHVECQPDIDKCPPAMPLATPTPKPSPDPGR